MSKSFSVSFRSASITTVVSITLVLFILGLLALLILNAEKITREVKEKADVSVYFHAEAKDADIARVQKMIDASDYAKSTAFISRDSAAKELMLTDKDDFRSLLGYNPLPASINIHIKAEFANLDSLALIEKQLTSYPSVKEVLYEKKLIELMNKNLRRIGLILSGFSILLLAVSITLINNTIRLNIYSKRFLIKTMQLVGATQPYIRRPFIMNSIYNGIISSMIALLMIMAVVHAAQTQMPDMEALNTLHTNFMLAIIVLMLGIFISWFSTYFSLRRYLRLHSNELYY